MSEFASSSKKRKISEEEPPEANYIPDIEEFSTDSEEEFQRKWHPTIHSLKKSRTRSSSSYKMKKLKFQKTPNSEPILSKFSQIEKRSGDFSKKRLFPDSPKPELKRKRFDMPSTSKEETEFEIEEPESDDDEVSNIEISEDFDDENSKSPKNTTEGSLSPNNIQISQATSEESSQKYRFNTINTSNLKVKPGGYVDNLLKYLSEGQEENIKWDFETSTPSSQTKYFTVSHLERVRGAIMIFFMLDNSKCAIFVNPKDKIADKLKVGKLFAFLPDYEPYEIGDVKVYVGLTKFKFVP